MDNSTDILFRIISFAAFTITITAVALLSVLLRPKSIKPEKEIKQFKLISLETFKKLICFVTFFSTFTLIITGFFPQLILSRTISGYWLMLHVISATVFVCCLALTALMYAEQNLIKKPAVLKAITFWLLLLLALPLILSIVLGMFPLFGTPVQEALIWKHRYCTLLFSVVAILHTYLTIRAK
ncbi:MAG: hypothetical protein ACYSRQ_06930 [Planctomycetota bacterium]